MPRNADWPWWQQYTGPDVYRIRELLRAVMDLSAYYGDSSKWVWRGQANSKFFLTPGVHTRITTSGHIVDDARVTSATVDVLNAARSAGLDSHEGTKLPDLALLALLQHYGAATPLLDVSLDPLVGLYMAVVSERGLYDDQDGVLFAIQRPELVAAQPFDSRSFATVYSALSPDEVYFYAAPDVSERLKIQRGHFLIGGTSNADKRIGIALTAEGVTTKVGETWLATRMRQRGKTGAPAPATTAVASFKIPKQFKISLRTWLEERTDLSYEYVYPTPWHQPHLESFCKSHGRTVPA